MQGLTLQQAQLSGPEAATAWVPAQLSMQPDARLVARDCVLQASCSSVAAYARFFTGNTDVETKVRLHDKRRPAHTHRFTPACSTAAYQLH